MSKYETGILAYNPENGRFGMLVMDLWKIDGFHCGDCFDIWDFETEKWIPTRIEKCFSETIQNWYLVGTGITGSDLEGLRIRIAEY